MIRFLGKIVIAALAVLLASYILPGVDVESFTIALLVALVLGFLNAVVKPVLIVLTLPITVLTLGLFLLFINVLVVYLADYLIGDFHVSGFWSALFFSILVSVFSGIMERIAQTNDKSENSSSRY